MTNEQFLKKLGDMTVEKIKGPGPDQMVLASGLLAMIQLILGYPGADEGVKQYVQTRIDEISERSNFFRISS